MAFYFTHTWVTPIAFILQTMLMAGIVWFPKSRRPDKEYESPYIKALRAFPLALFFVFGVIFLEIFIEVVVLNYYGLATWTQTFPSAFIALVCGVEYVLMAAYVAPNVKTIVSTSAYTVVYLAFVNAYIPISQDIWMVLYALPVMVGFMILHLTMYAIEKILKKAIPSFRGDKRLWNIRPWFKRVFNVPVNVVIWALIVVEGILQFMGYSIITVFT